MEAAAITVSKPTFGQVVASFKKLTALVPVSNDMQRFADPAIDAYVRDDLVQVLARREDLAFIRGDGTVEQGNTLTIKNAKVDHSQDGSSWSTYTTFTDPGVVDTGGTGGTTQRGVVRLGCDLKSAYRYVGFDWTPDHSAASTDTACVIASATLAGFLPPLLAGGLGLIETAPPKR